jgi:hypothetical protein
MVRIEIASANGRPVQRPTTQSCWWPLQYPAIAVVRSCVRDAPAPGTPRVPGQDRASTRLAAGSEILFRRRSAMERKPPVHRASGCSQRRASKAALSSSRQVATLRHETPQVSTKCRKLKEFRDVNGDDPRVLPMPCEAKVTSSCLLSPLLANRVHSACFLCRARPPYIFAAVAARLCFGLVVTASCKGQEPGPPYQQRTRR